MDLDFRVVSLSAVFAFFAGFALWPPRAVYWSELTPIFTPGGTILLVGVAAVALGAAFELLTDADLQAFAAGTVVAYVVGAVLIALLLGPESPVHLVWYALLGLCLFAGVASIAAYRRMDVEVGRLRCFDRASGE
jgi:asparagine N-glycosylation enzyme membrane subunit Stt3